MLRKSIVTVVSTFLIVSSAQAALLTNINGTVLVNKGEGFWEVNGATVVSAGDRVLVRGEGRAQVDYGDGCVVKMSSNQSLVVSSAFGCDKSALYTSSTTSGTPASSGSLKDPPAVAATEGGLDHQVLIVGGLVVAGGAAAVIAVQDDDKPASP